MTDRRDVLYTARAHVISGRSAGHGRTSDGVLEVDLRTQRERGDGGGTNPEQLFEAIELVRAPHEIRPYSNASRGDIDVALTANGRRVATGPPTRKERA